MFKGLATFIVKGMVQGVVIAVSVGTAIATLNLLEKGGKKAYDYAKSKLHKETPAETA